MGSHEFSPNQKNVTDGFPWPLGAEPKNIIVFHAGNWNPWAQKSIFNAKTLLKRYRNVTFQEILPDDILSWFYTVSWHVSVLSVDIFWQVFLQILFGFFFSFSRDLMLYIK